MVSDANDVQGLDDSLADTGYVSLAATSSCGEQHSDEERVLDWVLRII